MNTNEEPAVITSQERAEEAARLEAQGHLEAVFNQTTQQLREALEPAVSELQRELGVRERCFPRWIELGKVSRIDAKDRFVRHKKAVEMLTFLLDIVGGEVQNTQDDVPF
jgi:hypothetical protein